MFGDVTLQARRARALASRRRRPATGTRKRRLPRPRRGEVHSRARCRSATAATAAVEVKSGLAAGESGRDGANFLVDSESRLQGRHLPATGGRTVIRRIIRFSAENQFSCIAPYAVVIVLAVWRHAARSPLDAMPDLSDTQVIVYSALGPQPRHRRGPGHLSDRHRAARRAEGARRSAASRTSASRYVYVIFEDGTDLYWARTRVLEYLSKIQAQLPAGVTTELGPDATGVGWVFQYALVDTSGQALDSTSCGPFRTGSCATRCRACPASPRWRRSAASSKQYQVTVDPEPLAAYGLPLEPTSTRSARATTRSAAAWSSCPGASTWCAGRGYVKPRRDLEQDRGQDGQAGHAGADARRRHVALGPADSPRHHRPQRRRRHGGRHRRHALRRERAARHRPREGEARRSSSRRCPRASKSSRPTTARS